MLKFENFHFQNQAPPADVDSSQSTETKVAIAVPPGVCRQGISLKSASLPLLLLLSNIVISSSSDCILVKAPFNICMSAGAFLPAVALTISRTTASIVTLTCLLTSSLYLLFVSDQPQCFNASEYFSCHSMGAFFYVNRCLRNAQQNGYCPRPLVFYLHRDYR